MGRCVAYGAQWGRVTFAGPMGAHSCPTANVQRLWTGTRSASKYTRSTSQPPPTRRACAPRAPAPAPRGATLCVRSSTPQSASARGTACHSTAPLPLLLLYWLWLRSLAGVDSRRSITPLGARSPHLPRGQRAVLQDALGVCVGGDAGVAGDARVLGGQMHGSGVWGDEL
ncbi:hypothetical protein GGX14DRAFT_403520 [Mycena pura]|uniref:Uncharacterized protein n=1 Tax=Mycena pura TaxID=153505 RepID=A0AAD6UZY6_9AGAR|nr:hypothetical protein GGX14DRAFT_403520 [Mycena pura]